MDYNASTLMITKHYLRSHFILPNMFDIIDYAQPMMRGNNVDNNYGE